MDMSQIFETYDSFTRTTMSIARSWGWCWSQTIGSSIIWSIFWPRMSHAACSTGLWAWAPRSPRAPCAGYWNLLLIYMPMPVYDRVEFLPGQLFVLHTPLSSIFPVQLVPPLATRTSIDLVLWWVPPPQVFVHVSQLLHILHSQLTKHIEI